MIAQGLSSHVYRFRWLLKKLSIFTNCWLVLSLLEQGCMEGDAAILSRHHHTWIQCLGTRYAFLAHLPRWNQVNLFWFGNWSFGVAATSFFDIQPLRIFCSLQRSWNCALAVYQTSASNDKTPSPDWPTPPVNTPALHCSCVREYLLKSLWLEPGSLWLAFGHAEQLLKSIGDVEIPICGVMILILCFSIAGGLFPRHQLVPF